MTPPSKIIVTCAVTGANCKTSISPYLPLTPDEIADAAVGTVEEGRRSGEFLIPRRESVEWRRSGRRHWCDRKKQ